MAHNFNISAKNHGGLLSPLFSLINQNAVIPIISCVLIQKKNGNITFTTTDLESFCNISIPCEGIDEFIICLESSIIKNLINYSLGDLIQMRISNEKEIDIKDEGFKLKAPLEVVGNYPKQPSFDSLIKMKISGSNILPILREAIYFVSHDDLRPSMTGVCIIDYKNKIHVVATDAHKLYFKPIIDTPEDYKGKNYIIPAKAVRTIIEMFSDKDDIEIIFHDQNISFKAENKTFLTRKIDARFPDFSKVIPTHNLIFLLNRKKAIGFLKLANEFVNKSTGSIALRVSPKEIEFAGGDLDFLMKFNYELPILESTDSSFEPYSIGFNSFWLKEIFLLNPKAETIKISHNKHSMSAVIIDDCCLVMPLIINDEPV